MKKARETHNIPPDPNEFELYVDNYQQIFASLKQFMMGGTAFISNQAGTEEVLKIYQLPKLMYELRNAAPDVDVDTIMKVKAGEGKQQVRWIPSVGMAEMALTREPFMYWRGLGCDFHEDLDNTRHCALATAKGLAYTVADYCSEPFNVKMKPGRHAPMAAETRDWETVNREKLGTNPDAEYKSSVDRAGIEKARAARDQAVIMEWINPWGTKISVNATPAGVTTVSRNFDPNTVEVGERAAEFPGHHPELMGGEGKASSASSTSASAYYTGRIKYF